MKSIKTIAATIAFLSVVIAAPLWLNAAQDRRANFSREMTRACIPVIGDSALTLAATTGTDADSGALSMPGMWMLRCDTDAWIRFGAAAVTAAVDDWRVNAGEVYFIPTGGSESMAHISALSVSSNGDCRILECK